MATLTQDEMTRLQRYVYMADDLQTYRNYGKQIRDAQDRLQSHYLTPSEAGKERLQQQIADLQQKRQEFPSKMQETYQVDSLRTMSNEMRRIEPLIERAYQQQQPPGQRQTVENYLQHSTLDKAYALMQEEQQRRQAMREQDTRFQQFAEKNLPGQAQAASQPLTDQQIMKNVENFQSLMSKQQQLQQAVESGRVQMEQAGKDYLSQQMQQTQAAWNTFIETHRNRIANMPNRPTLPHPPLLTGEQMVQMARQMDTAGLEQRSREVKESREMQGIEHPETKSFEERFQEQLKRHYEQHPEKKPDRTQQKGKSGPDL